MKKMIILLVALLLLGGGGAGAYFYLFSNKAEAAVPEGEEHEKAAVAEGEHGAPAFQFVEMDPLILPIVDNEGVSQVVSLVIALEVTDQATADEVKAMTPKLKDAFIQDMYGVLNKQAALKGGVIQVSQIKQRLNMISNKVLGEEKVHDVLLQVVQQRPI